MKIPTKKSLGITCPPLAMVLILTVSINGQGDTGSCTLQYFTTKCKNPALGSPDDRNECKCVCTAFMVASCVRKEDSSESKKKSLTSLHPLDPLSPADITTTANALKNSTVWTSSLVFNTITLLEPPKADLVQFYYNPEATLLEGHVRRSLTVLWDIHTGRIFEGVVNLRNGTIERFGPLSKNLILPQISPETSSQLVAVLKHDPAIRVWCKRHSIENMSLVSFSAWSPGYIQDRPEYRELKRPFNFWGYVKNFREDNEHAHPIPFIVVVDLVGPRVVAVEDLPVYDKNQTYRQGLYTIPKMESNYDFSIRPSGPLRTGDKPIVSASPLGVSFKVTGNAIEWQGFKLRVGFNAREGLVLYNVQYQADPSIQPRPILHRASISEAGVIYGDPRPPFHRRFEMDGSDDGMGFRANSLSSPTDCIGHATFLNVTLNDNEGNPVVLPNALCIFEDDDGVLWRHANLSSGKVTGARSHRLNVMFVSTIGEYDYVVRWSFYQDASIRFMLKLSGQLTTSMSGVDVSPPKYGTLVLPQVYASNHQHLFALRLDMDVDGVGNTVVREDAVLLNTAEGDSGIYAQLTPLKTQAEGVSDTNPESGRVWIITNPNKLHPYTKNPVGYKLIPVVDPKLMLKPDSPILDSRVRFATHDIWTTRHKDDQLFVAGTYINMDGLPDWVDKNPNASIEDTDVVLWHVFSPVHNPRVEDFPIMPVEERTVWLRPYNFFLENPGLNVPPPSFHTDKKNEL